MLRKFLARYGISIRFVNYFFSYLVMLIVFTAVISFVYRGFYTTLRQEVESSGVSGLAQLKDIMDGRLEEMQRITFQVASNPKLTPYMVNSGGYSNYEVCAELKKLSSANFFIYETVLYYNYRDTRKIFATSGIYDCDMFFNFIYKYENWSKEAFIEDIKQLNSPLIRPVERVMLHRLDYLDFATYIYPIAGGAEKPLGVVMFLIDSRNIQSIMHNILKDYTGHVYILDEKMQTIAYSSSPGLSQDALGVLASAKHMNTGSPVATAEIGGKSYSIVKVYSSYNGWSYMSAIPNDVLMQKVYRTKKTFIYAALGIMFLGTFAALMLATRNYRPLRNLVTMLGGQNAGNDSPALPDEIDYISRSITKISDEKKGLMSKLKSQAGLVRDHFLHNLINGKYSSPAEIKHLSEIAGVRLEGCCFAVLRFIIDDYKVFDSTESGSMKDIIRYSIINVLEELSLEIPASGYGLDLHDVNSIVLVLCMETRDSAERKISELAYKTKDFFKQHFSFTLTAGVSSTFSDILSLPAAFSEASKAAYYRLIKGSDRVIFYSDINRYNISNVVYYPSEKERQLVLAITQGDKGGIQNIIDSIFSFIETSAIPIEAISFIRFSIVSTLMKTLDDMGIAMEESISGKLNVVIFNEFETLHALKLEIIVVSMDISDYIKQEKEGRSGRLKEKIISYVDSNYPDKNISLEIIADQFGLSPSYITRFFKEQTGCTLMKYIDMLRMNKAKSLLESTGMKLTDIMDSTGYIDEANFIRKFKKNQGITPMQYRESFLKKQNQACRAKTPE